MDIITEEAEVRRNETGKPFTEDELIGIISDFDGAILGGSDEFTSRVIEAADRLKVIGRHGVGLDNVDLKAATEKGIVVTYTPGLNSNAVAEFTFALMLAVARKVPQACDSMKGGKWEPRSFIGSELSGKTLGVIGAGEIGEKVIRKAKGFDMNVICYTAHPEKHQDLVKKYNVKFVDLETLLRESDIVTIHCALTEKTKGMIGKRELALMKKSAILINTARGPIVDEEALYEALKNRLIAGAGLDVYTKEPPGADFPLLKLDNVVATPHIAAYTWEAMRAMDLTLAQDVMKVLHGERPKFIANPEVLDKVALR